MNGDQNGKRRRSAVNDRRIVGLTRRTRSDCDYSAVTGASFKELSSSGIAYSVNISAADAVRDPAWCVCASVKKLQFTHPPN